MRENPYRGRLHELGHAVADVRELSKLIEAHGGPVAIDLGCGNGDFALGYAEQNPETLLIGIDVKPKRLYKASRKTKRRNLTNLRFLFGDVPEVVAALPAATVDQLFLNFPDPWMKRRQLKKRILRLDRISAMRRVLKSGGELTVKSDHPNNIELASTLMDLAGFTWVERRSVSMLSMTRAIGDPISYYEREFLLQGLVIRSIRARRTV